MSDELMWHDAHEQARLVRERVVSPLELVDAAIARLEAAAALNVLVHTDFDAARVVAARPSAAAGSVQQPLAGVPLLLKDLGEPQAGLPERMGSRALKDHVAMQTAWSVERYLAAGAIVLGRTNTPEFGNHCATEPALSGPTLNPWDRSRSPGGSSGGSAAAVAAGLAALALGTDTGGSIREPAAQCGVVGVAPSHGLVPIDGVVPFAPALDRAGPLARTVGDAALLLDVLTGQAVRGVAALPRRVGLIDELAGPRNRPEVRARLDSARAAIDALGIEVVAVSVPDAPSALSAYMRLTSAACVPLLEPWVRTGQAGHEVVRRWTLGRRLLGPDVAMLDEASAVADRLTAQCRGLLQGCDVLLSPTMPTTAPLLTARTADVHDMSLHEMADPLIAPYTDCWTVVANLAGLPSLSVPFGTSPVDGMPVGMMLSGAAGSDDVLLALAARLETAAGTVTGPPGDIAK